MEGKPELESGSDGIGEARLKLLLPARSANVEYGYLDGTVSVVNDLDHVGSTRSWDGGVNDAGRRWIRSVGQRAHGGGAIASAVPSPSSAENTDKSSKGRCGEPGASLRRPEPRSRPSRPEKRRTPQNETGRLTRGITVPYRAPWHSQ